MELSHVSNFLSLKNKKPTLAKFLIFQEMELSSPKLKKLLIFQEELPKPKNQTKKSALKTFLVFLLNSIKNG